MWQAALNITHLIVGHTISAGGRLWRRCDGDVLGVDVAIYMVRHCLPARHGQSVLQGHCALLSIRYPRDCRPCGGSRGRRQGHAMPCHTYWCGIPCRDAIPCHPARSAHLRHFVVVWIGLEISACWHPVAANSGPKCLQHIGRPSWAGLVAYSGRAARRLR